MPRVQRWDQAGNLLIDEYIADPVPSPVAVDEERDKRIADGFVFQDVRYQARPQDRENIYAAALLASVAIAIEKKAPTSLRWHGGNNDFVWIAADNSLVPMDAQTVIMLAKALAVHQRKKVFAARALKERATSGEGVNIYDDGGWADA